MSAKNDKQKILSKPRHNVTIVKRNLVRDSNGGIRKQENFQFKVPPPPCCITVFERRAAAAAPQPAPAPAPPRADECLKCLQRYPVNATCKTVQNPPNTIFIMPWMSSIDCLLANIPAEMQLNDKFLNAAVRSAYGLEDNSTEPHSVTYSETDNQEIASYFN